jgi:hypothetical protein
MSEPTVENSATDDAPGSSWQERKSLILVAGGVGAVVLGVGAWFLLAGGSADDGGGLVAKPASKGVASAPAASGTATSTAARTVVPAKLPLDLAKDPFKDLYPPKPEAGPATSKPPEPTTQASAPVNLPGAPLPTSGPAVPQPTSTIGTTIAVVRVNADKEVAKVTVNGGPAVWMELGDVVGDTIQVVLAGVTSEGTGTATFYVGSDPDDTVDIEVGDRHRFA